MLYLYHSTKCDQPEHLYACQCMICMYEYFQQTLLWDSEYILMYADADSEYAEGKVESGAGDKAEIIETGFGVMGDFW